MGWDLDEFGWNVKGWVRTTMGWTAWMVWDWVGWYESGLDGMAWVGLGLDWMVWYGIGLEWICWCRMGLDGMGWDGVGLHEMLCAEGGLWKAALWKVLVHLKGRHSPR